MQTGSRGCCEVLALSSFCQSLRICSSQCVWTFIVAVNRGSIDVNVGSVCTVSFLVWFSVYWLLINFAVCSIISFELIDTEGNA